MKVPRPNLVHVGPRNGEIQAHLFSSKKETERLARVLEESDCWPGFCKKIWSEDFSDRLQLAEYLTTSGASTTGSELMNLRTNWPYIRQKLEEGIPKEEHPEGCPRGSWVNMMSRSNPWGNAWGKFFDSVWNAGVNETCERLAQLQDNEANLACLWVLACCRQGQREGGGRASETPIFRKMQQLAKESVRVNWHYAATQVLPDPDDDGSSSWMNQSWILRELGEIDKSLDEGMEFMKQVMQTASRICDAYDILVIRREKSWLQKRKTKP